MVLQAVDVRREDGGCQGSPLVVPSVQAVLEGVSRQESGEQQGWGGGPACRAWPAGGCGG